MIHTYNIDYENKTISVKTNGCLIKNELAAMGTASRIQAMDLDYKIIFDYSQSENYITITEAYYWFSDHYDKIDRRLREIPTAIITNKKDMEFFKFVETTCTNVGINIKVFLDENLAINWIRKF